MADSLGYMSASEVTDSKTFARYCHQQLGTPAPTMKEMVALRKHIKNFFDQYPYASYQTLVHIVHWAQNRGRRPAHSFTVVHWLRYAWADGCLPELDPGKRQDPALEADIAMALGVEHDPRWRDRLLSSEGIAARREVYDAWVVQQQPQSLFPVP